MGLFNVPPKEFVVFLGGDALSFPPVLLVLHEAKAFHVEGDECE
jgi:hypothetical protein